MNRETILQFLSAHKEEYLKKYHLSKIILFGSFAQNRANETSDVDIVYELEKGKKLSADAYFELLNELESAFERKVDFIREKRMNPIIKMEASKDFIYV
ncbi:MAG: nucleotidyltransferase domain-containing protein [Campylobacterota bacterium]|nr:nucleotidyltransferase domain-containing protein [Campylobacterota bacterium]